jgi:hypothetical protein
MRPTIYVDTGRRSIRLVNRDEDSLPNIRTIASQSPYNYGELRADGASSQEHGYGDASGTRCIWRAENGEIVVLFQGKSLRALGALAGAAVAAVALASAPQAIASGPAHRGVGIGIGFGAQLPVHSGVPIRPSSVVAASQLRAVYCTSPANCWAVGAETDTAGLNQVQHWNGKAWSEVDVPSPGGTDDGVSELRGVRCTSPTNCWAVGDYFIGDSATLNQILHWNGKTWRVTAVPQPGGTRDEAFSELIDVACTSPGNCWAAGGYGKTTDNGTFERNEALHWNGKTWTQVRTPNPAGTRVNQVSVLTSIRCASAADCWGVGADGVLGERDDAISNEALHWNGRQWGKVTLPNPGGTALGDINELANLSCTSAANCWTAGFTEKDSSETTRNELLRWDGKAWRAVSAPNPDGTGHGAINLLGSVSCTTAADCWAVGSTGGQNGNPELNEALHWNGARWSVASTPEPSGQKAEDTNELNSVRCTSAANCWAVGLQEHDGGAQFDQFLHWTGKRWFPDSSGP